MTYTKEENKMLKKFIEYVDTYVESAINALQKKETENSFLGIAEILGLLNFNQQQTKLPPITTTTGTDGITIGVSNKRTIFLAQQKIKYLNNAYERIKKHM